jgi:hypothetical protein
MAWAVVLALAMGFSPAPRAPMGSTRSATRSAPASITMKKWEKRQTLADTTGGVASVGEGAVGLIGNVPVTFTQGNESISTKAIVGQPLSEVASQCGQYIKYQCRKGECGTCEVRINGQWTRTCVTKVPHVAQGETFAVHVRGSMVKTAKSSRFYSFKSILAGAKNNLLGMVGFVREGKRSDATFKHRIDSEKELLEKVKARKAARLAEQQKQ